MPFITWKVFVDWDLDGVYTTSGDDITAHVIDMSFRNGMSEPFQLTSDEAELTMRLSNDDKRFSPNYSAGTYYGKLLPQRPVRISAVYSGATATMYQGWIETIDPSPFRIGDQYCVITATGAKMLLQDTEVFLPLLQDVTADQILDRILGLVTFPPASNYYFRLGVIGAQELGITTYFGTAGYTLETGNTTFAYVGDSWENGISANDAIERVMRAERGRFFYDRSGQGQFYNRQHYQVATAVAGTINNSMTGGDYKFGADYYPVVRVNCAPRTISAGSADVLWTLESPVRVSQNGTAIIRARYADNSGGEISGLNIGTPTFTMGSGISMTRFEANARSAEAEFVNSSTTAGSVTDGTITGQKLTQWNQIVVEAANGSVVYQYGKRTLSINADLLDSTADAEDVAYYEMNKRSTPRGAFRHIEMQEKGSTSIASLMYSATMGSRINVQETQTGDNQDYFIVGEEWHVSDALRNTLVRWTLEPTFYTQSWVLGITGLSNLGTATLGY